VPGILDITDISILIPILTLLGTPVIGTMAMDIMIMGTQAKSDSTK
jgi:hypothetical protein